MAAVAGAFSGIIPLVLSHFPCYSPEISTQPTSPVYLSQQPKESSSRLSSVPFPQICSSDAEENVVSEDVSAQLAIVQLLDHKNRLYQWTLDECIPEFYSDPHIFYFIHSEMNDLAVPSWASSPEEFILEHHNALESDRVSQHIHHWIDITFGYKLSGEASIEEKNMMLLASDTSRPRSMGRRQLFIWPHPMRHTVKSLSDYTSYKEAYNGLQRILNKAMVNSNEKSGLGCASLSSSK